MALFKEIQIAKGITYNCIGIFNQIIERQGNNLTITSQLRLWRDAQSFVDWKAGIEGNNPLDGSLWGTSVVTHTTIDELKKADTDSLELAYLEIVKSIKDKDDIETNQFYNLQRI
jgi:hypothetical protein